MSLKDISYLELWRHFCSAERTHLCNFVDGIMRNNSKNFFKLWPVYQGRCRLKYFLSGALAALVFSGAEPFMQL